MLPLCSDVSCVCAFYVCLLSVVSFINFKNLARLQEHRGTRPLHRRGRMPPIAPRADAAQRRVGDCAGERTRALHVREQRLAAARGLGLRLVPVQQHNVVELPAAPGRAVSALPASSGRVGLDGACWRRSRPW